MRFRVISDIHLEFYKNIEEVIRYIQWTDEDKDCVLLLAGDIGIPVTNTGSECPLFIEFLQEMKRRFIHVILITGNHEYYLCKRKHISMKDIDKMISTICENTGVFFLQMNSVTIEDVTIYGCALFTNLSPVHAYSMNDVKRIASRSVLNDVHQKHLKWLNEQTFTGKTIIMTHHVPMLLSNKHTGFYCDVLPQIQDQRNINYWVCGHTHDNINIDYQGTKLLSCCIGYPDELERQEPLYFDL